MHIAEVVTIAKSLPLLRLNTYKSLILSYSADYRRIFRKKYYTYCSTDFINHCSIEPRHPKALIKGCSKHDSGRAERRLKDKAR